MANLVVSISGETKAFEEAIDKITAKTSDLEASLGSIATASGVAFAGIVASAGLAVHAYAESEQSSKQLVLSLQNQGIASNQLVDDYKKLATQIQNNTGIDDDAIIAGEGVLQSLIGQTKITGALAQSMADLSIKTGSVESAATILGKGIEGNTKGLKKFGIEIDDGLPKNERMAQIIEKITQKFGGLAEVNNSGLGAFKGLSTAFGNFLEGIGQRMAPLITSIVVSLTDFFTKLADNQPLLDFIFETGKIALIVTGVITALATTAITIIKVQQAFQIAQAAVTAFGLASKVAVGATGLGLLLIIGAEVYANWNKIFPVIEAVYNNFVERISDLTAALGLIMEGVGSLNPGKIKEGFDEATAIIADGFTNIEVLREADIEAQIVQDETKKQLAVAAAEFEMANETAKVAGIQAQRDLNLLNARNESAALIELKKQQIALLAAYEKERNTNERLAIQERLAANQLAQATELQKVNEFNANILANNEAFMKMNEKDRTDFLQKNQAALNAAYFTEKEAQNQVLMAEFKQQIDSHNQFLVEQQKYGTAYATINQAMNSDQVTGAATAFGKLSALQKSKNAELKAIGKAAAIANITIQTAQAAMAIFAGFSAIPIVGVPLGIIGAAAAVIFGAEQISDVISAADGGMITGGIPGKDSVPVMAMPGELVVPQRNFDEVVNSVAAQRQASNSSGGGGGGYAEIVISLKDDLMDFIETKMLERQRLNISIPGAT